MRPAGLAARLPDFPWDRLAPAAARARTHPGGIVDLSVGTPVDPTPTVLREVLAASADAPGYPQTWGTPAVREAVAAWFARRRGVPDVDPDGVLPTVGSKELVAWLPLLLGLGAGDVVALPAVAYPTYDVGARVAGATPGTYGTDDPVADLDALAEVGPVRLVWVNSPANPTGEVQGAAALAAVVAWARRHGAVVASDECYAELDWSGAGVPSLLDPAVAGGSHTDLLVLYSLSKQSNLAGYRAALAAGDPALVRSLVEARKHAGMIVPAPVQAVLAAALGDDSHVAEQKERYRARRDVLAPALAAAGLRVDHSVAGLYLWATPHDGGDGGDGGDCWATVARLADLGVLVAPGDFYGPAGRRHVRVALTATDERVAAAAARLGASGRVFSPGPG